MVKQIKVVMSLVGPFTLYGELLVKVCAENGVHCCDLTGEMLWTSRVDFLTTETKVDVRGGTFASVIQMVECKTSKELDTSKTPAVIGGLYTPVN
ncbi:hypothetical protein PR003_g14829 [Phytophthora rubi]|uniref:Uncharacterized protein n=1 Tax=Phytophthora rubi TaxID=129364 RepID=A0A6A3KK39_9STRA|nr:hypothetical protein PR002_g18360 [Phytophthora rubi]KAE9005345.1 hypothetical protein PR001_g17475 [Phytophthora rubi]KAE9331811.1 hypothetical protein PR003_g14829 [Phytophthora rubi]